MITLYVFGPAFGLPDPSPFVMKTEVQLKMAGIPYRKEKSAPMNGPKGKLPYIDDDGTLVGDSTFIREHLAAHHGLNFDGGLTAEQRAQCWTIERMLEDHLYWAIVHMRWMIDENFANGPAHFFDGVPETAREEARRQGQERVRAVLHGQGVGRHTAGEVADLGERSLLALSTLLGDRDYQMGARLCSTDATAFGVVAGALAPLFDSPLARSARAHKNLVSYCDRMMSRFYPEHDWKRR
jgi:glutathione S-transferase